MILTWNVRGAAKRHFVNSIRDLNRRYNIRIMVLLEPRISGDRAVTVVQKLGYSNCFLVDAEGYSGGIWLLWQADHVHLQVVACSPYSITSLITMASRQRFFAAIYASPQACNRRRLWYYLDSALHLISLPWMFAGDFNEVLSNHE